MDKFTELLVETEGGGDTNFRKLGWILIEEEDPKNWQVGEPETIAELAKQRWCRP
jgi:hypothetical protein